jgi:hypothetical protein
LSKINYSPVSKPFVIGAVILLFIGSTIGSMWMMNMFGITMPAQILNLFHYHKILQLDGFLTLLIMGIGYMIIPRFRNIPLVSTKLAYVSFILIITSIILQFAQKFIALSNLITLFHISGIMIFAIMMLWTMRITPKLLRKGDYFITFSIVMFTFVSVIQSLGIHAVNSLTEIQMWLIFPVLMIFGIEYKTLPAFLGFIRPRDTMSMLSLFLLGLGVIFAGISMFYESQLLSLLSNVILMGGTAVFVSSLYISGGFDNKEFLSYIRGERRVRYDLIILHTRISFTFLFAGLVMGIMFNVYPQTFAFYDLAIHYVAIGFIGTTIMLYLPLLLPPIIEKTIRFGDFNKIPLLLVVTGVVIRTMGDFALSFFKHVETYYFLGISGLLVLAGMFSFVIMIHKAMIEKRN